MIKDIDVFDKTLKKLITEDKFWSLLNDYSLIIPKNYGLTKFHKPEIPLRMSVCIYIYIYIYTHTHRKRERDTHTHRFLNGCMGFFICLSFMAHQSL